MRRRKRLGVERDDSGKKERMKTWRERVGKKVMMKFFSLPLSLPLLFSLSLFLPHFFSLPWMDDDEKVIVIFKMKGETFLDFLIIESFLNKKV